MMSMNDIDPKVLHVTVTGQPSGVEEAAGIPIPAVRQGFEGGAAGVSRFAQYAPTRVASPEQLNQPVGQEKADELAKALGLDKSQCFTEQQYLTFISGKGANGSGDPASAELVDASIAILTNSTAHPLTRSINGAPTRIVLGSYGLMVDTAGMLESPANAASPVRQVNTVIVPGGYLSTWCKANGATASLEMLYRSAYTPQFPHAFLAQHERGAAELAFYRDGLTSAVTGMPMVPSIWEVNFLLIYLLSPTHAAKMPAYWAPIHADVVAALVKSSTGQVPYSEYASYF
jgi:hypothetical protein